MVDLVRDRIDKDKVQSGVWVDIDDFGSVLVRRFNNKDYIELARKLRNEKLDELGLKEGSELGEDIAFPLSVKAVCKEIILDWKGIESDGEPVPYDPDFAFDLFTDPDNVWRDEFNAIVSECMERSHYVVEREQATLKN